MRIPSGVTDQYIYFVAVDATDYVTRETGLTTFTVYRSRNGGTATAYTTPTISELSSSNMPGVYRLLLDEDMTIDSGDDSQEVCLHITHSGMAPVTRVFELYRNPVSAGATLSVDANGRTDIIRIAGTTQTARDIGASVLLSPGTGTGQVSITAGVVSANAVQISGDATAADNLEAMLDGTGGVTITAALTGNVTGNLSGSVGSVTGNVGGNVTGSVGSVTGNVGGNVTGSVGSVATGGITAASIAADAIGASELAADAASEIATAVWAASTRLLTAGTNIVLAKGTGVTGFTDLDAAGVRTAVGLASANLDTQISGLASATNLATLTGYVDTEVAAIKAKTDNLPSDPADASDVSAAFSTVNSTLSTIASYIDTEVGAIKAKTDLIPASPAATGDIPSAATIADAVHDEVVEGTTTLRQSIRLHNAALGGKASGLDTTSVVYRDLADSKDRISATVDADGNRTAVTRDLT